MASTQQLSDLAPQTAFSKAGLLVVLASLPPEHLNITFANLSAAFGSEPLLVATPDAPSTSEGPHRILSTPPTNASWALTAADFLNAYQLADEHHPSGVLILGPECHSLEPAGLRAMASAAVSGSIDLAVPRYHFPPNAGLVNSAILYPVTRALFATRARFPLAVDLGLSLRMAERLATAAQRYTALNQNDALLWPIDEAASAGLSVTEIEVGPRSLPQPAVPDLNTILAHVTGSLFADVDARASFWQRARTLPTRTMAASPSQRYEQHADTGPMIDSFRLAYTNLGEIWSLVLPPNSLLGLKRLAASSSSTFRMADSLWARIVYDFLLAFRLRTINRGHLLGALTPLYLAWAASHIQLAESGVDPEVHIESLAEAFEADKPYLVSRWRWPDRFNP